MLVSGLQIQLRLPPLNELSCDPELLFNVTLKQQRQDVEEELKRKHPLQLPAFGTCTNFICMFKSGLNDGATQTRCGLNLPVLIRSARIQQILSVGGRQTADGKMFLLISRSIGNHPSKYGAF